MDHYKQRKITDQIALRFRGWRQKKYLSQEDVGKQLGVTFQQIQKYESGKNRISATRLYVFCQKNNIDPASFFNFSMEEG